MIQATSQDRSLVIDLLAHSFEREPHTSWLVSGSTAGHPARLRKLMAYAFDEAIKRQHVFLSDDRQGVAVWKQIPKAGFLWSDLLNNMRFALDMDLKTMKRITGIDSHCEQHPRKEPLLYLWLLGVAPEQQGKGVASCLIDSMLDYAQQKQLPVYLETATEANVRLYERKGFSVYHQCQPDPTCDLTIRFMHRE